MRSKVILDRVEGDKAILEVHGYQYKIILPRAVLPPSAKEGDVLNLEVKKTRKVRQETLKRKKEARTLIDKILKRK